MKKKYINLIIIFLIIIILTLLNKFEIIKTNRQILKEMTSSDLETNLNAQINKLNDEHTEYRTYIQECKTKIATALTNEGVETSDQILLEEMAEKIPNILQARTSDATATAEDILEGKTAYVDGELLTGTFSNGMKMFIDRKPNTLYTADIGFKPKELFVMWCSGYQSNHTVPNMFFYYTENTLDNGITGGGSTNLVTVTETGFVLNQANATTASGGNPIVYWYN